MMCFAAPSFAVPAGCFEVPPTMPMSCVYGYEDNDAGVDKRDVYFGEINTFLHQPTPPASLTTTPQPMSSEEVLTLLSQPIPDIDLEVSMLRRGIKTMQIAVPLSAAATYDEPTTPVANLRSPFSYSDDMEKKTEESSRNKNKKMDPSWTYDANIDATFREMEKDPTQRPSETDFWKMQNMTLADRAGLVELMYCCCRTRELPPGTLHRAVNYFDRYLSLRKIHQDDRFLLAITAVFAAAKYEASATTWAFNADDVAFDVGGGCTRCHVLAMERDLVATLGYQLSGPTAYTFVDHFTRHDGEEETDKKIKYLAHHLVEIMLLHCCSMESLPSAVAASAILLATRHVINSDDKTEQKMLNMTGYKLDDLTDIIDAIYDMHEFQDMWPGCELMVGNCAYRNYLPPRY